jgi:hypothetical protein
MLWQTTTKTVVSSKATRVAEVTRTAEQKVVKAVASNKQVAAVATKAAAKTKEVTNQEKVATATVAAATEATGKKTNYARCAPGIVVKKQFFSLQKGLVFNEYKAFSIKASGFYMFLFFSFCTLRMISFVVPDSSPTPPICSEWPV